MDAQERARKRVRDGSASGATRLQATCQQSLADAAERGEGILVSVACERLVFAASFLGELLSILGNFALPEVTSVGLRIFDGKIHGLIGNR